jgi:hypothetical protein
VCVCVCVCVCVLSFSKCNFFMQAFIPPTALKLMRLVPRPERFGLSLRSVGSGGESLGDELLEWGKQALYALSMSSFVFLPVIVIQWVCFLFFFVCTRGPTINEFYGQTECNLVVSACQPAFPLKPRSMGRAVPGHTVLFPFFISLAFEQRVFRPASHTCVSLCSFLAVSHRGRARAAAASQHIRQHWNSNVRGTCIIPTSRVWTMG